MYIVRQNFMMFFRMQRASGAVLEGIRSTPVVLWLSYLPLDPRFVGSNPAEVKFFSECENPEYDFLWKGSKAMVPMS